MTDEKSQFGYWLGVSQNVGSVLTYQTLTESRKVIASSTVHHVPREDILDPQKKTQFEEFDAAVCTRLNDENFHTQHDEMDLAPNEYLNNQQPDDDWLTTPRDEEYGNQWGDAEPEDEDVVEGAADLELYEQFISTEVTMHNDSELRRRQVVKRA